MQDARRHVGGATVVISLRVRAGHEAEYERWQAEIDTAAEAFTGFEGSEVLRPRAGVQDDWVVVYRFDTASHLTDWMRSEKRAALLKKAESHVEYRGEHVVATPRGSVRPVTVVVTQRVDPAHTDDYEQWQDGVSATAAQFPGFLGSETFKPVQGVQDEWVVVFRFASPQTLQRWLDSDVRQRWLDKAQPWVRDVELQTVGDGLGGWFPVAPPGQPRVPAWKQSLTVLVALYPTVMVLAMVLMPRLESVTSMPVSTFLGNVASVAILSWLAMPLLTRLLTPWLHATDIKTTTLGTGAIAVACGAMIALFSAIA